MERRDDNAYVMRTPVTGRQKSLEKSEVNRQFMIKIGNVSLCAAILVSLAQTSVAQAVFPLKLSENHRYLVDQNGKPFLMVGDTPQGLMGRLTEEDAEYYFADREAHGFNTMGWIDVMCAGNDYKWNKDAVTPDGIKPFNGYVAGGTDFTHY